jgi:hypothetical protein
MLKKLTVAAILVVSAVSMVGIATVNNASAAVVRPPKVTICHRTNAVVNPYNEISVNQSSVDGVAGNSGNQPDHYSEHQGPIFDAAIHNNGDDWGDIIPPVAPYHTGLNWTVEGQAIYNNGCKPVVPPASDVDFDLVCDVAKHKAVITFSNTGNAAGSATVNNTVVAVPVGGVVYEVATAANGTQITIVIDNVTVYDQLVTCEPGRGSQGAPVEPETPKTPEVASLPNTAGDNTGVVAAVSSLVAGILTIGSVIVKSTLLKQ